MVEVFSHKKISPQTLGKQLIKLRTKKGLSSNDVAQNTKIRPDYINALESGDWDMLPTPVYTRGFIRSYAYFIGGNSKSLLRHYDREYNVYKKKSLQSAKPDIMTVNSHRMSPIILSRAIVGILVASIIIAITVYLYTIFRTFVVAPFLIITTPIHGITVHDASLHIQGQTVQNTKVQINKQDVLVGDDGVFANDITLSPGVNTITIQARNRFDKLTQKDFMVNFEDLVPQEHLVIPDVVLPEGSTSLEKSVNNSDFMGEDIGSEVLKAENTGHDGRPVAQ